MAFLYPNFLFFFFALAIPILIHLFNYRRYKKISFTNVSMLKDIEIESKSVKKIRNLLILISRLLALSFLILAFAQPFFPSDSSEDSNTASIAVYVDNSFSMESGESGNSSLEKARQMAHSLIEGFGERRYFLLTNDFRQSDFNELSKKEMLAEIDKIDITYLSKDFTQIVNRFEAIKEEGEFKSISAYLLSDFQISQFPDFSIEIDSNLNMNLVKMATEYSSNLSLDSCWIKDAVVSVQGADTMSLQLSNHSDEVLSDHPIRLYINEQQVSLSSVDVGPWSTATIDIPIQLNDFGTYRGRIETVDDGISEDNQMYFSFNIDSAINIYQLGEEGLKSFKAVYQAPLIFNQSSEKNVDISLIESSDVFLLDGQAELSTGLVKEIEKKVREGAVLVVYPRDSSSRNSMNEILMEMNLESLGKYDTTTTSIEKLNLKSNIFKEVIEKMPDNPNLPRSKGYFNLKERERIQKEDILSFTSSKPALRKYIYGNGSVFVFTFGLNAPNSNFSMNSLFVPVAINIAYSSRNSRTIYSILGEEGLLAAGKRMNNNQVVHVKGNGLDVIPEIRQMGNEAYLNLHNQITEAGTYDINLEDNFMGNLSLNNQRNESDPRLHDEASIEESLSYNFGKNIGIYSGSEESIQSGILSTNRSKALWKYCVILALLFFVAEVLIIKLIKT